MFPVSHLDKQEKQAQRYSLFPRKYSFHINQISSRDYIDIDVSLNQFGENYALAMGAEDTWDKLQKIAKLVILRALVFSSNRL